MISNDLEWKPEELVLPFEKHFKYCEHFSFECAIVVLSIGQLFQHEPSWATCLPVFSLTIERTHSVQGCIADEPDWLTQGRIYRSQYWVLAGKILDHLETAIMDLSPEECVTIPLYTHEWCSICRHIWHELCQVFNKSNEPLYLSQVARCPPLADSHHFVSICMDTMLVDHMPKAVEPHRCRDCPVPGCICRIGSTDTGLSTLAYVGLY